MCVSRLSGLILFSAKRRFMGQHNQTPPIHTQFILTHIPTFHNVFKGLHRPYYSVAMFQAILTYTFQDTKDTNVIFTTRKLAYSDESSFVTNSVKNGHKAI